MALKLEAKAAIVAAVHDATEGALAAAAADYRGMTVADMTAMRATAREHGVWLRVVRNTLGRRAVAGTQHEPLREVLQGPTLLALSHDDPGAAARLLRECCGRYDALEVKGLSVGAGLLAAAELDRVANLPTLDGARAQLMAVMIAPVAGLARSLADVPARLARALAAVQRGKASQGDS